MGAGEAIMQKTSAKRLIGAAVLAVLLACFFLFAGCARADESDPYVTNVVNTGTEIVVTYSDGSTKSISTVQEVSASAQELYEYYKTLYGDELTYDEFLQKYLTVGADNSAAVGQVLLSSVKFYTEFYETNWTLTGNWPTRTDGTSVYTGSGVIYKIDEDYVYFITNYHVVYSSKANANNATGNENGQYIARAIYCYLYGSENDFERAGTNGNYATYDYGDYAIECEYVGGSLTKDIALVRAKTADVTAIRSDIREVTFADGYSVGETAIAVGNAEGEGISVTEGIVSVASEDINLNIDGTTRSYRSMRIDSAIYGGNSGGGLFNAQGELIGITNAGDEEDQNINYAVPLEIVRGVADNIYHYAVDGDASTNGAYIPSFGASYNAKNSRYVYDSASASGKIVEDIEVRSVESGSVAAALGLQAGDVITSLTLGDAEYTLGRSYNIADILLSARAGDAISCTYTRGGESAESGSYTLSQGDLASLA